MADDFYKEWGLSPSDAPAPPDVGVGPTRSYDTNQFDKEWLGSGQTPQVQPPSGSKPLTFEGIKSVFTDPAKRAQLAQTPIGRLVTAIGSGLTYPGDVAAGKATVPQSSNLGEEDTSGIGRLTDLASIIAPGSIPGTYGAPKALIQPETASLASIARNQFGIPIRGGQISESQTANYLDSVLKGKPFSGMAANEAEQHGAFNRAVAKTIGEDADKVTPDVMANAKERLGQNYEDIARATTLKFDQPLNVQLNKVVADAASVLQPSEHSIINKQVQGILDKVKGEGTIDGQTFHALIKTGSPLDRATKSTDSNVKYYASQVKGALIDAMDRSAPEDMKGLLKSTNSQYKAMKTIEDLVEKSPTGDISPALLMGAVRKSYSNMAYGGGGDLADLARIGQRFLKEPPQSGTQPRLSISNMLTGGGVGIGELAALYFHDPIMGAKVAALGGTALAGKAAINKTLGSLLTSDRYANKLINSSLPDNAMSNPNFLQKLVHGNMPYLPPALGLVPQLRTPQYQP